MYYVVNIGCIVAMHSDWVYENVRGEIKLKGYLKKSHFSPWLYSMSYLVFG